MTKAELVSKIAEQTGYDRVTVLNVVEEMMTQVKASFSSNESVFLRGFGSFITKTRKEKIARNIKAETTIVVPEHKIPAFKPSKEFVKSLK